MFSANIHFPPVVLLLFIRGVAAAEDSTEFTLNVFTDIAPILALFGEQFAQQYLSQSFTWLDHLIFACVPLGIITALSGAIRTRGPRLARSFIGRARENLATVELGLMSSVSHEVCEMFNGSGIIRTMGRSTLAQIMIFPDEYDTAQSGASDDSSCGIHTLQTALQSKTKGGPLMVCSEYQGKTYQRLRRVLNPKNLALKYPYHQKQEQFDFKCPPNLQLNLSTGHSSRSRKTAELSSASITAVVLQLSLLSIAAVVAYHGRTSRAVGFGNNPYAFPCYAIGSALLCAGMAICSAAIESSTDELVWTPWRKKYRSKIEERLQTKRNPYIMWIQQPQSVGDQTFDAYAILGGSKPYVLTSSRSKDLWTAETSQKESGNAKQSRRGWWEALTMIGVLLGSLGFIIQFIGLRGLPWPVAVSQLMAILIMALIRALIRRGVGVIPLACVALPGHELDFLATRIVFYPDFREFKDGNPLNGGLRDDTLKEVCHWEVMTPNKDRRLTPWTEKQGRETGTGQDSRKEEPQTGSSQQLVKVRERLGDLCKWKTSMSETAVALAQLIKHFMSIFFEQHRGVAEEADKIMWATKTSALCDNGNDEIEKTTVAIERKNGKWVAELGKIEAILSLWMASIKARQIDMEENRDTTRDRDTTMGDWRRSSSAKIKFERIVGDGWFDNHHDSLLRDISWWVGDSVVSTYETKRKESSDINIGFDTPTSGHQRPPHEHTERLSQSSTATLPSIMAQHLFTSFIWAISEHLPRNCLHQGESDTRDFVQVDPATGFNPDHLFSDWRKLNLSHPLLMSVVKEGESLGLGTVTDILLCVIPALGFRDLLPNEAILGLMPSVSERIQRYRRVEFEDSPYAQLIRSCSNHDGENFAIATLVETVEFILLASPSHDLMGTIEYILRQIIERYPKTLRQLAPGYHLQNRGHKVCEIFRRCGFHDTLLKTMLLDQDVVGEQELATFRKACGWSKMHYIIESYVEIRDSVEIGAWFPVEGLVKPDVLGWTPLHYVATKTPQKRSESMDRFYPAIWQGKAFSCLDKSQRSPFHIAASSGYIRFLEECIRHADANTLESTLLKGGFDGKTPLHLAVEGQHLDCVELLLKHSVPSQGDIWGQTLMHLATLGRSYVIGKKLLAHFPEPLQVDELGSTPLTYLLRNEKDTTLALDRTNFAKELMATWTMTKADDGSGNSLLHYAAAFLDEDEIENLVKESGNVNISNRQGQTPLHLAALEGRTVAVRRLVSLGAQVESVDDRGWSALHYAANCRDVEPGLVSFILKTKNDAINTTERSGKTPLHLAAAAGNTSAAMLFVSEGAELGTRDKHKDTPLRLALMNDRKEMIDGLLSCDGAVDTYKQADEDGFEHIDVAIRCCNTECLGTVLLHAATTMSMRTYGLQAMVINGRTWEPGDADLFDLVFESIPERHLSILDLDELINLFPKTENSRYLHQAWDSRRDDLKEDPWALHFLAQVGDTSTLEQLLEAGANVSHLDKDNWMPSDIADRYGHRALGDLLREHLAKGGAEPLEEPSYRVPTTFWDVYHEFDLTQYDYDKESGRKKIEVSGTFRDTGLICRIFRTQECIPPNVSEYSFMAGLTYRFDEWFVYL
ncbi:hypothetical protein CEP51_002361 [Fusarium floridanum]|uniref:Protein SSH4 n=1 Tax=Fusarium floridanum TaxID=1325733 RepID=A0A428SBM4_9HYPO|nr:hypothetical protein CEP51_002361 [Fusarium floridanum]